VGREGVDVNPSFFREVLAGSPSWELRNLAALALQSSGDPLALGALRRAAEQDPSPIVRATTAACLTDKDPDNALATTELFVRRMEQEDDPGALKAILTALSSRQDPRVMSTLLAFGSDPYRSDELRLHALAALQRHPGDAARQAASVAAGIAWTGVDGRAARAP
jgi:HEAT repeat protein